MTSPDPSSPTIDDQLFDAAQRGDTATLASLLDSHPDRLNVRSAPYEWSLLHAAAHNGHEAAVDLLLTRGLDPNSREKGDNTYAMHWAAAAGHLAIVRRLADAGGDVVGHGDDHGLEVIGWATCWNNHHEGVAEFLVSRGARHHIFSAVALNLAAEVRQIVAADPWSLNSRLTRNDNHRTPLHHAILNRRPEMVALLIDFGADPLAPDGSGFPAVAYATSTDIDRRLMEKIREMTDAELVSAARGNRLPRVSTIDLVAALALHDWEMAEQLARADGQILRAVGPLHIMAKRGDLPAVQWLLDRGADPNGRWSHWDAEVVPLHMAAAHGHTDVARWLLQAGADARVRDSKHGGDALSWAEFFGKPEVVELLKTHGGSERGE